MSGKGRTYICRSLHNKSKFSKTTACYEKSAQTREVLTMNYIAYISCMSVELVIMLLHVSLIASECGMRCGEGAVAFWYILFGVTGGLKLITNIVSAWNMMVYADEMQSKRLL